MASRFGRVLVLVFSLALPCGSTAIAQPRFTFDETPGVLPKDVVPSRCVLTFDLDPARDEFSGQASSDRGQTPRRGRHRAARGALGAGRLSGVEARVVARSEPCGHERCVMQGGAARLCGARITASPLSRNEDPG